jgi:hypothetical protein
MKSVQAIAVSLMALWTSDADAQQRNGTDVFGRKGSNVGKSGNRFLPAKPTIPARTARRCMAERRYVSRNRNVVIEKR